MGPLVVRHEVLEFGSSPVSPWLNQVESLSAIRAILEELLRSGNIDDRGRSEWGAGGRGRRGHGRCPTPPVLSSPLWPALCRLCYSAGSQRRAGHHSCPDQGGAGLAGRHCCPSARLPPVSAAWCPAAQVLLDLLAAVVEPADLVQRSESEQRGSAAAAWWRQGAAPPALLDPAEHGQARPTAPRRRRGGGRGGSQPGAGAGGPPLPA